jgi:SAM-dependent methyltransferase
MPESDTPIPCALCGAQNGRTLYRPARAHGPVVRCSQCGLVYISPRTASAWLIHEGPVMFGQPDRFLHSADLADIQDSWEMPILRRKEAEWPALRRNARDALARLARFRPGGGRLLDFGCGGGFFLGAAAECGWEVYGLEPLPAHAVYARARFGAQVVTDTLRPDSFPLDTFDVITAFQVFEHLPDPPGALRLLARLLKPGGLVLIEVPNIETWSVRLLGRRHRHFVQDHLYFFSARTLSRLMEACGLEALETYSPRRQMTVRHLVSHWGPRALPAPLARAVEAAARRAGLWEKIVSLGVGDIVAAIGRRPPAGSAPAGLRQT